MQPLQTKISNNGSRRSTSKSGVVANSARDAIMAMAEDDPATSDLFTEVSRQLDKDLWVLEAHLDSP